MVREGGLDLACGPGRLGLQGAHGALLRALGFKSRHFQMQKAPRLTAARNPPGAPFTPARVQVPSLQKEISHPCG